jgi:hypothetical protein
LNSFFFFKFEFQTNKQKKEPNYISLPFFHYYYYFENLDKHKNLFSTGNFAIQKFIVIANSPQEKETWINAINETINSGMYYFQQ